MAWSLLAIVVPFAGVIAYVRFAFDPSSVKPHIARWLQANYKRQLAIDDIQLQWSPSAQLALSGVRISDPNSAAPFLLLKRGLVTLQLRPLLRREVVVDALTLEGLTLEVRRFADGRLSIDDLLQSKGDSTLNFDIAMMTLREASAVLIDEASGQRWRIALPQASAAPLALGKPGEVNASFGLAEDKLRVQAKGSVTGAFQINASPFAFTLDRIAVQASGNAGEVLLRELRFGGNYQQGEQGGWRLHASDAHARLARPLVSGTQSLTVSAGTLRASADRVSVPQSKFEFSARDTFGEVVGAVRADVVYEPQRREWRARQLQFDASWQRDDATRVRVSGGAELSAQPAAGTWQARALSLKSSGNVALTGQRLQFEAESSEPGTVTLTGDVLDAALRPLRVHVQGADFDLRGETDAALSGSLSGGRYALRPLTVKLEGTRAGARVALELHSAAHIDALAHTLSAADARFDLQHDARARHGWALQRASLRGAWWLDWAQQKFRFESNTALRIASQLTANKTNEVMLSGVLDLDYGKPAARFAGRAKFDASKLKGHVSWLGGAASPAYAFDVDLDTLDWDKYASGSKPSAPVRGAPQSQVAPEIDLAQLRALAAKGVLRIGVLKADGVTVKNVTLEVQ